MAFVLGRTISEGCSLHYFDFWHLIQSTCRKHAPFAWCDCVKVYCAVNNQVETFIEQRRKLGNKVQSFLYFCYKEVA